MQAYQISVTELLSGGEESEALARWFKAMRSTLKNQFNGRILTADTPMASLLKTATDNTA